MKREICILGLALMMLCAASCGTASGNSDNQTSDAGAAEQTTTTAQESVTGTKTENGGSMDITESILPEDAKDALLAYINSDSYESLADSILPTAAAQEAKNGKAIVGNYYFWGFGPCSCENVTISECSRMPKDRAERLGIFWSAGFSMQGFSCDFTAEDSYETVVSADCVSVYNDKDTQIPGFRCTQRLAVLKIKDDRWIVVPYSDETTNKMEPIQ